MKLATFRRDGAVRLGVAHAAGAKLFDLDAAARRDGASPAPFASMLALIDADDAGLDAARALFAKRGAEDDLSVATASVALLAPLPDPRQIRDAMSYSAHIRQSARGARAQQALREGGEVAFRAALAAPLGELPDIYRRIPIFYIANRFTISGPEVTVTWPRYSEVMDYELEIAAVTRRARADIPLAEAGQHVFGYTIFNDFSARDRQALEMQGRLGPAKGKSFEGANAFGPFIVTPDEIGDPQALRVAVRVNGETRAEADSGGMLFSFEELLAYVSQDEVIRAGEVFGSGTIGGCCGLESGRLLASGDVIELEVENIGVLRNKVVRRGAPEASAAAGRDE